MKFYVNYALVKLHVCHRSLRFISNQNTKFLWVEIKNQMALYWTPILLLRGRVEQQL